jgi:hypothetical protein
MNTLPTRKDQDTLVISNVPESAGEWQTTAFFEGILLCKQEVAAPSPNGGVQSWSLCSSKILKDILIGCHRGLWSGSMVVNTGFGVKTLHFLDGEIVFAESNLFEDRLGEVTYREGLITLEELSRSAGQVSRDLKFGQVLVQSRVFSNYGLWNALKEQIRQIIRSIFMVEQVYIELQERSPVPSTRIVFKENTQEIIKTSFNYGCSFKSFVDKITPQTVVKVLSQGVDRDSSESSFTSDLITLINGRSLVHEFVEQSKLVKPYTLEALMKLVNLGLCVLESLKEVALPRGVFFEELDLWLSYYDKTYASVSRAFEDENLAFPIDDLRRLGVSLDIYILVDGTVSRECKGSLYNECREDRQRLLYFKMSLRSLVEFLIVVTSDHLSETVSQKIATEVGYINL